MYDFTAVWDKIAECVKRITGDVDVKGKGDLQTQINDTKNSIKDAALTIKVNGAVVKTFSANAAEDATVDITIPAAVAVKGSAEGAYRTGNVNITAADIGLGNVNNTADANKSVSYANSAGSAGTANNAAYANNAGNADTVDGRHFHWHGRDGQPSWLWGANDPGTDVYVYNPSNFNVNYANSAGYATSAGSANYANSAGSAETATKATHDANGKNISDTYAPKNSPEFNNRISMGRRVAFYTGSNTVALGYDVYAAGNYSQAFGYSTSASGQYSHAEGMSTSASGRASHAEGSDTSAQGDASHAEGYFTTATGNQHAQGHYNDTSRAEEGEDWGTGSSTGFVIGNGTDDYGSNAARIDYNGKLWCKSAYSSTGADYAEYFEWEDGNPNNEDRVGRFVTFGGNDGTKIKIACEGDYILGIVSGQPAIIGNQDMEWSGQFMKDDFGRFIIEEHKREKKIQQTEDVDEGDKTHTKSEIYKFYKVNPDYNPDMEYTFRDDRPEWSPVGMLGVLSIYDNGDCIPGSYCKAGMGGIAVPCEREMYIVDGQVFKGYRVLERINDNIIKVVFR